MGMDPLPLPPNPPAGPGIVLAHPAAAAAPNPGQGSGFARAPAVAGDLVLLPLRLLRRLLTDLAGTIIHLWLAFWNGGLAVLGLSFIGALWLVETFGENFFLGEVFAVLVPGMKAYASDATAAGRLLVAFLPFLDEIRASTVVAFVVAGAAVGAIAVFFCSLKRVLEARARLSSKVQEALLLDPESREVAPAGQQDRPAPLALVGLVIGAGATVGILLFEVYAFTILLRSHWLGPLSALVLLCARVVVGYLAHLGIGFTLTSAQGVLEHVESFVRGAVGIIPNLVEESLHQLRTLGTE